MMPRVVPRPLGVQVAIKKNTYAAQHDGSTARTPSVVATRHATLRPMTSRELFDARQIGAESTHMVRFRYDSVTKDALGKDHWLEPTIGTRKFEIVGSPRNEGERNMFIVAECKVRED